MFVLKYISGMHVCVCGCPPPSRSVPLWMCRVYVSACVYVLACKYCTSNSLCKARVSFLWLVDFSKRDKWSGFISNACWYCLHVCVNVCVCVCACVCIYETAQFVLWCISPNNSSFTVYMFWVQTTTLHDYSPMLLSLFYVLDTGRTIHAKQRIIILILYPALYHSTLL